MKILGSIVVLVLLVGIVACSPSNRYEKEIAMIDSSLAVLDTIETQLNGIDFDSLEMMVEHVLRNEDTLKKYYSPDTVSLYIGIKMNECKGIRKTMGGAKNREATFQSEVELTKTQFLNLKDDIENGVLEEDKMNQYLTKELNNLNVLNEKFTEFYYIQKSNKLYYRVSVPVIDSLIVELKNENTLE